MYNDKIIEACLAKLVGFLEEDYFNSTNFEDYEDLFTTESGLYFQQAHPLVCYENLKAIAPLNTDETQKTDDQMALFITNMKLGSIKKVLAEVWQRKRLNESAKTLLSDTWVYKGSGNVHDKEIKQNRFVGFQIILKHFDGISAILNKIITQFDTEQELLKLYLYHTSSSEAVEVIELELTKENRIEEHITSTILNYVSSSNAAGGAWFIGYYEEDLVGQALNKDGFNFYTGGCMCSNVDNTFKNWSKYFNICPIAVTNENLENDRSLWDYSKNIYYSEGKTFGLNFSISAQCDLSDMICRNRNIFRLAVQYQFAVDVLEQIAHSIRTNIIQEKTMQKAMFDLENKEFGTGLREKLRKEIEAIDFDFSQINKACLPCNKQYVRYGTIG